MSMHDFQTRPAESYTYHAFDIETDGLVATSSVTTLTLNDEDEYVVFARSPDGEPDDPLALEDEVAMRTGEEITLVPCASQADILATCKDYVTERFSIERDIITAYNGETWKSGFDLKVLRTAAIREGDPTLFPFKEYPFTDAYEVIVERDRIHTDMVRPPSSRATKGKWVALAEMMGLDSDGVKDDVERRVREAEPDEATLVEWAEEHNGGDVPTASLNGLGDVYELLTGETLDYDEYDDSAEAVTDFEDGNLANVITHNVADVVMTDRLMEFVVQTVPQSDYTPTYL